MTERLSGDEGAAEEVVSPAGTRRLAVSISGMTASGHSEEHHVSVPSERGVPRIDEALDGIDAVLAENDAASPPAEIPYPYDQSAAHEMGGHS